MASFVTYREKVLAIVIRADYSSPDVEFFTPSDYSQQVAQISHKKGGEIRPHIHNHVAREVYSTHETLLIRKGKLRVDLYNESQEYIESHILNSGDVILLVSGGHGFKVLEDVDIIEVKQGPYLGIEDKVRFIGAEDDAIRIVEKD